MHPDTAPLHAEIDKLNAIINILMEKNRQLEAELACRRPNETSHPTGEKITSKMEMSVPPLSHILSGGRTSYPTMWEVASEKKMSDPTPGAGPSGPRMGFPTQSGIPEQGPDGMFPGVGTSAGTPGRTEHGVLAPVGAADGGSVSAVWLSHLAEQLTPEAFTRFLKAGEMTDTKTTGAARVAEALLLLCARPKCSHADLGRWLGLSNSGVNKMVRSLKRRGLIQRTGFQQFSLTEKTGRLMAAAAAWRATKNPAVTPG